MRWCYCYCRRQDGGCCFLECWWKWLLVSWLLLKSPHLVGRVEEGGQFRCFGVLYDERWSSLFFSDPAFDFAFCFFLMLISDLLS